MSSARILKSAAERAESTDHQNESTPDHEAAGREHDQLTLVHEETGEVRVSRWLGSFDCGKIVNPTTAVSQLARRHHHGNRNGADRGDSEG
jgi:hypothetical protein